MVICEFEKGVWKCENKGLEFSRSLVFILLVIEGILKDIFILDLEFVIYLKIVFRFFF